MVVSISYRSPSSPILKFLYIFDKFFAKITLHSCEVIFAGDFNINFMQRNDDTYCKRIINTINDHNLKQLVIEPIRIIEKSETLIDYVLSNIANLKVQINRNYNIIDYETIQIIKP